VFEPQSNKTNKNSCITAINVFKPQHVQLHTVFIVVISYVMGVVMHKILPSKGVIGRILNPGPFNKKEHSAIVIMTAAAGSTPEAMSVLAVQKLWYNIHPTPVIGIFVVLSTQLLGYGVAGMLRKTLVYPSKMLYPMSIPTASLLENLHRDKAITRKRMRVFWIGLIVLFCWHVFPAYIMPLLAGISIFCLTHQNSLLITNLFGGSMANEGLGVLSISLDWNMLTSGGNPLWLPFQTITNSMIGYLLAIPCFMLIYYRDTWSARSFPFLSPLMYSTASTSKKYVTYNQTSILDHTYSVQENLLQEHGLPNLTATHVLGMIVRNMGITATIAHMALWHWDDIKSAFEILSVENLKKLTKPSQWNLRFWKHLGTTMSDEEAEKICPHYRLMQAYDEVPSSWFATLWIAAAAVGLVTTTLAQSTLPWVSQISILVIMLTIYSGHSSWQYSSLPSVSYSLHLSLPCLDSPSWFNH
jgi:OPT family oligopeptide transporter